MLSLGSLAFLNPWVLAGLAALPVLWWLLRAIPPSPRTQVFAGVRLLLGLEDEERQTDRTPWWLLLLRCLAVAAALIGFSQPVLNLTERIGGGGGPLLLLMDAGWASAPDWAERSAAAREILAEADQAGREVLFWPTDQGLDAGRNGQVPPLVSANAAAGALASAEPRPWAPDHAAVLEALRAGGVDVAETVWLHDGLAHEGTSELLAYLSGQGRLRLIGPSQVARGLTPPRLEEGVLTADVLRAGGAADEAVDVVAMAAAEGGGERRIAVGRAAFAGGAVRAPVTFDLPTELQNEVTRIALALGPSAGGAAFADGAIRRVSAGLVAPATEDAVRGLISPVFYLEKALVPWADLTRGDIATVLAADPAVVILADQGEMTDAERSGLAEWVEAGGLLVRFAGPRLAAAIGAQNFGASALVGADDPLLPVRLRRGGRVLGGALAWTTPRALGPFDPAGPFRGLQAPDEVEVRTQVLAEPSPELAGRVWATLEDGTPLVTGKRLGEGHVVLFHVSSDAEWSSLPLSGLFVEMLGRLMALAPGRTAGVPDPAALAGTLWRAETLMGADGAPRPVSSLVEPVPGERLAAGGAGPDLPPGVYARAGRSGDAGATAESLVVNLMRADSQLAPFPPAPAGAIVETLGGEAPVRYGPWLIGLALLIACVDVLGTLIASGRLAGRRRGAAAASALLVLLLVAPEVRAQAEQPQAEQPQARAIRDRRHLAGGGRRHGRDDAGLCAHGRPAARRDFRARHGRARQRAGAQDGGRARAARRRRARRRRAELLPGALLAADGVDGAWRRRARGAGRLHPQWRAADHRHAERRLGHGRRLVGRDARDRARPEPAAARACRRGPCADAHLLSPVGLPRALARRPRLGRGAAAARRGLRAAAGRHSAIRQGRRQRLAGAGRLGRLGGGLGGRRFGHADVPGRAAGRPSARDGLSVRRQRGHVRADGQLQVRPGARPRGAATAGPMRSGPMRLGPVRLQPARSGPVRSGPVRSGPVRA